MNEIIEELLKNDIKVELKWNKVHNTTEYVIDGFYKSGSAILINTPEGLMCSTRYGQKNRIDSIEDLVSLNFSWWQKSKDRYDGWANPDSFWIPLLIKYNYIKESVKTEYSVI